VSAFAAVHTRGNDGDNTASVDVQSLLCALRGVAEEVTTRRGDGAERRITSTTHDTLVVVNEVGTDPTGVGRRLAVRSRGPALLRGLPSTTVGANL